MDIFMPIALCIIFLILFSICGWCCKRKREGTIYGYGPTVTVSTQPVHSSGITVPPYPVDARHPTPQTTGPPAPGFSTHTAPYPTSTPYGHPQPMPTYYPQYPPPIGLGTSHPGMGVTPYPPTGGSTPYPPPAGGTPYPPMGATPYPPDHSMNPPPYDVAVSSPPIQPPPIKEGYGKQAPYNPHYN